MSEQENRTLARTEQPEQDDKLRAAAGNAEGWGSSCQEVPRDAHAGWGVGGGDYSSPETPALSLSPPPPQLPGSRWAPCPSQHNKEGTDSFKRTRVHTSFREGMFATATVLPLRAVSPGSGPHSPAGRAGPCCPQPASPLWLHPLPPVAAQPRGGH